MLSPEVIAEQVMEYVVGAAELVPTLKSLIGIPYSVAVLPQGPHFYTGLLQAAGYLLLDNKKKKLLMISQQSDDDKNILIDNNNYGPVFGQIWKNSMVTIKNITRDIGAKKSQSGGKSFTENIISQLSFLRIITETKEIIHVSVGKKASEIQMKKLLIWIKNNIQAYNIILLTNIELPPSTTFKKSEERKGIAKIMQTPRTSISLLSLFQKILKTQKKEAKIIGYVNPKNFSKTKKGMMIRYICAIG